jgi:hypothetical protein
VFFAKIGGTAGVGFGGGTRSGHGDPVMTTKGGTLERAPRGVK